MLSISDKNIILNVIQSGEFPKLTTLHINLNGYTPTKITEILKGNDFLKRNYGLAEKIADQLIIEKNKLKKNLTRLIAFELNYYNDDRLKRDRTYRQISQLVSNLLSFPEQKRIIKFLIKFAMTSKALQSTVQDEKNLAILKVFNQINAEVK